MKIGFDVDDVLTDWYYTSHEYSNRAGINYNKVIKPTVWACHEEYGATLDEWLAAVYPMALDGFYLDTEPFPEVDKHLLRLKDAGHEVHLITSRGAFVHGERIKTDTQLWVEKHLPFVDSVTFSSDKSNPRTDYFLDDLPKNIDKVLAAGIKGYLLNQPWNRGIPGYDRVASVKGFVDLILHTEGVESDPLRTSALQAT